MKISFYEDKTVKQIGIGGDFELIETPEFIPDDFNAIDENGNRKYLYFPEEINKTCTIAINQQYVQPIISMPSE